MWGWARAAHIVTLNPKTYRDPTPCSLGSGFGTHLHDRALRRGSNLRLSKCILLVGASSRSTYSGFHNIAIS